MTQSRLEYDRERKIIREKSIKDFLSKVDKFTSNTYKDEFVQWLNENKLMLSESNTSSSINQLKDVFDTRPVADCKVKLLLGEIPLVEEL